MKKSLSRLQFFTIGGLLTLSGSLHAQLVLNQPNTTGVFTAPHSITLLPGFSTNGSFHAKIQSAPKPSIIQNLSPNQNYIVDNTIKVLGITNTSQLQGLSADELQQTVSYYDGLGRKMQVVQTQGSPNLKDIVTPTVYDNFGREVFKYLPFVAVNTTGDGSFKSGNPDALVKGFYNPLSPGAMDVATTLYPFGETQFENSPLNRVVKQGAPGDAWQLSQGHTINTIRSSNVQNEVRLWKITATGCDGSTFYSPNRLFKTITTDENGSENIEFKDLEGHIVLKQVQADNGLLNTYFIYDDFGNLKYVIPPLPQEVTFPSSFVESDAVFKNFIFAYDHDGRNRLTERKIPGKEWEYFVYNKIDQLVMTQDGNQRSKAPQEWTITKYDGLRRIVVTAIHIHQESAPNTSFRSYMQNQVDNQTTQSEIRDNSVLGYSSITYPSTWNTTLTVNYYDDYTFLPVGNNYSSTASGVSNRTKSLLTGTKINILNTSNMLLVANYYDEQGRLRESVGDNHLSGKDRVVNTYNFIGQVITSLREHQTSTGKVTIQNDYVYDHAGRKRLIKEKITGADGVTTSPIVIARYDYNEIGQLVKKYLHSEDYSNIDIPDVSSFLYSIAYSYNARGWSKTINSKEFTMSLEYESSNQRFNGDITAASWGTESNPSQNTFTYTYDRMNRLLAGNSTDMSENGITYDNTGNIKQLSRDGQQIVYNYSYNGELGNKLNSVTGAVFGTTKYFQYDNNGNVVRDDSRSISKIAYNYLNLPQVLEDNGVLKYQYTYDAAGNKLRSVNNYQSGKMNDYIGGIQYENNNIQTLITEEGQARRSGNQFIYEYWVKDHLGNTRVAFHKDPSSQQAQILQREDYYPFGLNKTRNPVTSSKTNYQYNGKELQENLNTLDYGKRFYDPTIARWHVQDPEAEKYYKWSPYNYVLNNPIRNVDPRGDTVRITITAQIVGQDKIRVVSPQEFGSYTKTVAAYNVTITDDVTGTVSEYSVTRDAPIATKDAEGKYTGDDKEKYSISNTAFEPKQREGEYQGAIRADGHAGSRVELRDRNNVNSATVEGRNNVQIHVGGTYTNSEGQNRVTGSLGCFTLTLSDKGNQGRDNFVGDVTSRMKVNDAAGKGNVILINVQKRDEIRNFNQ